MPGGLVALLDDITVLARMAAASADDIGVAASRAGAKTAGVVIDDAAVTPSYVAGLDPARELPIIWRITVGSLRNKLLLLLPGALLLSWLLPAAIVFVLILGGAYLSYEGAEKVLEKLGAEKHGKTLEDPIDDPAEFERKRIAGAIRTDLILSAEIMAITLNEVADESFVVRGGVLAVVAILVTLVVYGTVAVIVKMDDIGLHLTRTASGAGRAFGRFLLKAMPHLLVTLALVGTVAMLWVGGGIILHALAELGFSGPADWAHGLQYAVEGGTGGLGGFLGWATYAAISAIVGLVLGAVIAFVVHKVLKIGAPAH